MANSDSLARSLTEAIGRAIETTLRREDAPPSDIPAVEGRQQQPVNRSRPQNDLQRKPGRPKRVIERETLENLLRLRVPIVHIAEQLNVSRSVVYKAIKEYGISYERFSEVSQAEIEREVEGVKNNHPNSGEVMVQGHLASKGLHIQREKVRKAIHVVDPDGVEKRKQKPIKRRVYSNPFPNYL